MSNVEERVKKIVVEQLDVGEDSVTNEASFVDDLGGETELVNFLHIFSDTVEAPGRNHRGDKSNLPRCVCA